jgi:hypothetical protein
MRIMKQKYIGVLKINTANTRLAQEPELWLTQNKQLKTKRSRIANKINFKNRLLRQAWESYASL